MTTERLHTEMEARVYGRTDRPPVHGGERQVRAGPEVVAAPTVGELEQLWGHHRDEWPLLGPSADREETLAVVRRPDDRRRTVRYTLEREHPAGGRYVALETLDTEMKLDQLTDVIAQHHTGEAARPELDVLEQGAGAVR